MALLWLWFGALAHGLSCCGSGSFFVAQWGEVSVRARAHPFRDAVGEMFCDGSSIVEVRSYVKRRTRELVSAVWVGDPVHIPFGMRWKRYLTTPLLASDDCCIIIVLLR